MIAPSELARAVSGYLHRYQGESLALAPLWTTIGQHVKAGACLHMGSCPVVTVSPVIVDEDSRILMLRQGDRLALPEAVLSGQDALLEAAEAQARELGVRDLWLMPGADDPMQLSPGRAAPEQGPRMRVSFRFLFRTHAALRPFTPKPQTWVPLGEADIDLARRVSAFIADGQRV